MHCKAIKRSLSKKKIEINSIHCIVAFGSNKRAYMYSDWLNNFWIVQSHLPIPPHSTISVNNKPIQKEDVPICLYAYNTGTRRSGKRGGSAFSTAGALCIYSQGYNNCPSRPIHTGAGIGGELPEREVLLSEIYGSWGNAETHHGGKCHDIPDTATHLHVLICS